MDSSRSGRGIHLSPLFMVEIMAYSLAVLVVIGPHVRIELVDSSRISARRRLVLAPRPIRPAKENRGPVLRPSALATREDPGDPGGDLGSELLSTTGPASETPGSVPTDIQVVLRQQPILTFHAVPPSDARVASEPGARGFGLMDPGHPEPELLQPGLLEDDGPQASRISVSEVERTQDRPRPPPVVGAVSALGARNFAVSVSGPVDGPSSGDPTTPKGTSAAPSGGDFEPRSHASRAYLGRLLASLGKTDEAIKELEAARRLDNRDVESLRGLVELYRVRGDSRATLKTLETLVKRLPQDVLLRRSLGLELQKLEKYGRAAKHLEAIIQMEPLSARAHVDLGNLHFDRREFEKAARSYRTASRCSPERTDLRFGLAVALFEAGRVHEARKELRELESRLSQLHPLHAQVREYLARIPER